MKFRILLFTAFVLSAPVAAQDEGYTAEARETARRSYGNSARLETFSRKGDLYEAQATYPVFRGSDLLSRFVNWKIGSQARQGVREFEAQAKRDLQEFKPIAGTSYAYDEFVRLTFKNPRLISLASEGYSYTGGAHGMFGTSGLTFGILPGTQRPRELQLGDFFKTGSPYRAQIEKRLLDKLRATKGKEQEATWVVDGELKKLENIQLNNFVVEKDGLRWCFPPYAVGPYAAGQFEIKLSFDELGANFKRELLK